MCTPKAHVLETSFPNSQIHVSEVGSLKVIKMKWSHKGDGNMVVSEALLEKEKRANLSTCFVSTMLWWPETKHVLLDFPVSITMNWIYFYSL
jgi:hypothetical protein